MNAAWEVKVSPQQFGLHVRLWKPREGSVTVPESVYMEPKEAAEFINELRRALRKVSK